MKRIFALTALLALGVALGCKTTTPATPQTLAPGYANLTDQTMGETLVGARKFYVTIQTDAVAGTYTPSPTEKVALNNFATALNAAEIIYIGYHAGTQTQAQAQAAVNAVATQQSALQSTLTGGTK